MKSINGNLFASKLLTTSDFRDLDVSTGFNPYFYKGDSLNRKFSGFFPFSIAPVFHDISNETFSTMKENGLVTFLIGKPEKAVDGIANCQ